MTATATLTPPARLWPERYTPSRRAYWRDRLVASDPGYQRFRAALEAVVTIGVALAVEWLFVHFTHALQLPVRSGLAPAAAAQVGLERHAVVVVAMMLGAMIGMVYAIGVADTTPRAQLVTMLIHPVPMVAGLVIGLAIGAHRVGSLAVLVVLLTVGTWTRRFGPRGMIGGQLLFIGAFLGYFVRAELPLGQVGWAIAEIGIGVGVAIVVHFGLFRPQPAKALARMQRSWEARARILVEFAAAAYERHGPDAAAARRLHRQVVRLNETTLIVDAQVAGLATLPGGSAAQQFHQRLFDMELALINIARFAQALGQVDLPATDGPLVASILAALRAGDGSGAEARAWQLVDQLDRDRPSGIDEDPATQTLPHRFAISVIDFVAAEGDWVAAPDPAAPAPAAPAASDLAGAPAGFRAAAPLVGGWLPGAAMVSAQASTIAGVRRGDRAAVAPHMRVAVQIGVAAAAAILAGDALSGRRFYWALLAVVVTFMSVTNSGEQARRAVFRVAGTVIGIAIGSVAAHLVGHHSNWSIAVVLASIFVGLYLFRINYAYFVVGITVLVAQLYVQLDEFSNQLLVLRLEETAIGAAIAILTVTFVLPIRPRRVIGVAARAHLAALGVLIDQAGARLTGRGAAPDLRSEARALDATHQTLVATARPLRRTLFGAISRRVETTLAVAATTRYHGRDLARNLESWDVPDGELVAPLEAAVRTLKGSLAAILEVGTERRPYVRSAALFDRIERSIERHCYPVAGGRRFLPTRVLALHDLMLIDASLARLAEVLDLPVTDHDLSVATGESGAGR